MADTTKKLSKSYRFFDADTFETKKETVEVSFTPAATLEEAMSRTGNDQAIMLKALNSQLQRDALKAAKQSVLAKGIDRTLVLAILRPFRAMLPWSAIQDKAKQTEELLKMLRSSPAMIEAIRSATPTSDDDDEEDSDDE